MLPQLQDEWTMNAYARTLFSLIDEDLDRSAKAIRNRVFSEYRDMPWAHEQYRVLQPIIRQELNSLVRSILGCFDNVGSVLPEGSGVLGYRITALPYEEVPHESLPLPKIVHKDEVDIHDGLDYSEMWADYLREKEEAQAT
jgi:hypothetical protein